MTTIRTSSLTVIALLSLIVFCNAQQFVGCLNGGTISTINLTGNTCSSQQLTKCSELKAFSLAIYKDSLYSNQLDSLMCSSLTPSGVSACRYVMKIPRFMNALTVDTNGILYGASADTLYRIDPAAHTFIMAGRMPFTSAGDLFFFKGKLYLSSFSPAKGIVEVNLQNPSQSKMVLPTPANDIFGLVSVPVDCRNSTVFGLARSENAAGTTILELDMNAFRVVGIRCVLPFIINDAGSNTETGVSAGIGIQSITHYPECSNEPLSGTLRIHVRGAIPGGIYQYTLNGTKTNSSGQFDSLRAGTYKIQIAAAGGCTFDTFAVIRRAEPPSAQINIKDDTCNLRVGQLSATAIGGLSPYLFSLNTAVAQQSGIFTNLAAKQYQLTIQDSNLCKVSQTVTISNTPVASPVLSFTATAPDCYNRSNGSLLVQAVGNRGPYSVSFNSSPYQQQYRYTNLSPARYTVKVKDLQGCITDTAVQINRYIISRPVITVDSASPHCLNPNTGYIQLAVSGSAPVYYTSYSGKRYPANYRFANLPESDYLLRVTDSVDCELQSVNIPLRLILSPECNLMYVPNAFSPNEDGNNDMFKPTGYGLLLYYRLSVYNRYGNLLFSSSDIRRGWNGISNGIAQAAGTFIWKLDYRFDGHERQRKEGTVVLIR